MAQPTAPTPAVSPATSPTPPAWLPLAQDMLDRLQRAGLRSASIAEMLADLGDDTPGFHDAHAPDALDPATPLPDGPDPYDWSDLPEPDSGSEADGAKADDLGARPAAAPRKAAPKPKATRARLCLTDVLITLRLAALIGGEGGTQGRHTLIEPRALTVIETGDVAMLPKLHRVIAETVAHRPADLHAGGINTAPPEAVFALMPALSGSSIAPNQHEFAAAIRACLPLPNACLILIPDRSALPRPLADLLPPSRPLPPLCGAMIPELLRLVHGPAAPSPRPLPKLLQQAVLAALPSDDRLARLPLDALALALRASTPVGVAEALAAAADTAADTAAGRARSPHAPRLVMFDPDLPAVQALRAATEDLALWRAGKVAWSELTRSFLLSGPPGCGKTWMAQATAASAGLPLITARFADWQTGSSLGPMLAALRRTFAEARAAAPCLLFLDEFDAAGSRQRRDHNSSFNDQVIAALLTELDAPAANEGVLILAATNHPENIDPALLRPGRFDRQIRLDLPDRKALRSILTTCLAPEGVEEADLIALTRAAVGLSAAAVDAAIRAARAACRRAGAPFTPLAALPFLSPGQDAETHAAHQAARQRTAIHEAGHAAIAARFGLPISRILLEREGGHVLWHGVPQKRRADLEAVLIFLMAGRAAEEVLLGEASAGAGVGSDSDLALATRLACQIEAQTGLGQSGLTWRGAAEAALMTDPALARRVEVHLARALALAREEIAAIPVLVEALSEVLLREGEVTGEALTGWLRLIQDYDPEREEAEMGEVVPFPLTAPRADGIPRPDAEGPTPSDAG